jgi:hypothetical protein
MIIIEIQHSNDGTTATICTTHTDRSEAEQKYHQVLAAAAVSAVNVHSAVMVGDDGCSVKRETYYHGQLE